MVTKEQIQTHREREVLIQEVTEAMREAEQKGKTAEQLVDIVRKTLSVYLYKKENG